MQRGKQRDAPEYLPTPAQIREECERIQSEWDADTRRQRAGALANPAVEVRKHRASIQEPPHDA